MEMWCILLIPWVLWLSMSFFIPDDLSSFFLPSLTTHIHTQTSLTLQTPKYRSLSLPQRASSNHYWLLLGLIEGPSGLLVLLVNGNLPTLLLQSTLLLSFLFYLSISPLPFSHALTWFSGIDLLHLLTSALKIYWCSCPTLNTCWLLLETFLPWRIVIKIEHTKEIFQ